MNRWTKIENPPRREHQIFFQRLQEHLGVEEPHKRCPKRDVALFFYSLLCIIGNRIAIAIVSSKKRMATAAATIRNDAAAISTTETNPTTTSHPMAVWTAFEVDSVVTVSSSVTNNKPSMMFRILAKKKVLLPLSFLIAAATLSAVYTSSAVLRRREAPEKTDFEVSLSSVSNDTLSSQTAAVNLTLYHINPLSYPVDPVNMNTADLAGALFFDMWEIFQSFMCHENQSPPRGIICENAEYNGNDIGITQLVVEVFRNNDDKDDAFYGPYSTCNICDEGLSPMNPSHKCNHGEYVCDCFRSNSCTASPGRETIDETFGSKGFGKNCRRKSWSKQQEEHNRLWCAASVAAELVKGFWYSTLSIGEGSTWRTVNIQKRITKACHAKYFFDRVASHGNSTDCFRQCSTSNSDEKGNNASEPIVGAAQLTPCWAQCFADATLGPKATEAQGYRQGVGGMTRQELMEAWAQPFEPGVCQEVPL